MKKSLIKIVCLLIIVGLNWTGLLAVGKTLAYYLDNEDSNSNLFQATILDFSVTNRHVENFIGMEALSEIEFASVVMKTTGSLDIQYEVNVEKISSDDNFCDALKMEVEHNGVEKHDGLLLSFSASPTTQLGTWEFELDLPASATNVPHGAECNVDLVFKGWRSDVVNFEESGFTDEERIELRLTNRMIVLNEFLPNPEGVAYGFNFGDDSSTMLQGEWVELYNNSNSGYDLAGWYIWDASGDDSNKIFITDSNTKLGITTILAGGWLVVYMNKAVLDNTGDTVKLFDSADTLIDSYTYTADNDYCEIEPTPGDENTTDTSGSCGGVPGNKSYARIPDGIGYWVDPIPTPGGPNILESEIINQEEAIEEEPIVEEEPIAEELPVEETPVVEEEPVSEGEPVIEPVIEEEPPLEEENPPVEEELSITEGEEPPIEEPDEEIPVIEEEPTVEEVTTEENQEQGGIIEEINEIIDEVIEEIVDEIMPVEETGDEVVPEPEVPVIEDVPIIEEAPADETPAVEEQPATEEQIAAVPNNDSPQNEVINNSDNNGSDNGSSGDSTTSSVDSGGSSDSTGDSGNSLSE